MPIPTWIPGEVLASADVNSWFVPLAVVKSSNTSRTVSTISADPALTVTLAAGAFYEVRCMVFYNGILGTGGTGYLQWNWTAPGGGGGYVYLADYASDSGSADTGYQVGQVAGVEIAAAQTVVAAWTGGTSVTKSLYMKGLGFGGGSGGPLTFNWAQAVAVGTATTVMTNSYLIAQRIG